MSDDKYPIPDTYEACEALLDDLIVGIQDIDAQLGADMDGVICRDGDWRMRASFAKGHKIRHMRRLKSHMVRMRAERHAETVEREKARKDAEKIANITLAKKRADRTVKALKEHIAEVYGEGALRLAYGVIDAAQEDFDATHRSEGQ